MLLFLVRHGDPIYSPDSLTPLGQRQAEAVAKRLALYGIDRVYVSSSNRAKQTAVPTCEILHIEPEVLDWCNEHHAWKAFTAINSKGERSWLCDCDTTKYIMVSKEMRELGDRWYEHPALDSEKCKKGLEFVRDESDAFFEKHGYVHDRENHVYRCVKPNDERIALFAHAGFGQVFLSAVLDIPYPQVCSHFSISHSCFTVIQLKGDDIAIPQVLSFSNDSHLYREGLPTKWNNSLYF